MERKSKIKFFNLLIAFLLLSLSFFGCNTKENNSEMNSSDVNNSEVSSGEEDINNFGFNLSVEINKNVFTADEDILIDISLKNENSFDVEIAYFLLFNLIAPTASGYLEEEIPQYPAYKQIKSGETFHVKKYVDGYFEPGVHEIKYNAVFYLNWGKDNEQTIELSSNIVKFEIIS